MEFENRRHEAARAANSHDRSHDTSLLSHAQGLEQDRENLERLYNIERRASVEDESLGREVQALRW